MKSRIRWMQVDLMLALGAFVLASAVSAGAQVQTSTSTTAHPASTTVQVDNAEVVHIQGNDLIVKMSDGSLRHISNVPDTARATVAGQEMGIKDLKPGMKLQRTITTTTTPKVITTVQTVQGRVFRVTPPRSVILTLENGKNQKFQIPSGQKFTVDGKETDAFGLRKGMLVSATRVVEEPITVIERESKVTGQMPTPPAPQADLPILVAVVVPGAAPAQEANQANASEANQEPQKNEQEAQKGEKQLPKTGSELPLLGLFGTLALFGAAGLRLSRKMRG